MKLSASTLGCPGWDLPTVIRRLVEYGYQGVDFRGLKGNLRVWELPEFGGGAAETAARVREAGLAVSCFSAGARLVWRSEAEREGSLEEIRRTAELCGVFGSPLIRIFGGEFARPAFADALSRARDMLGRMLEVVGGGVRLAVETHDSWTAGGDVLSLVEGFDRRRVGVCWDVKHTVWSGGEAPVQTWERLGRWVVNTHWKDVRGEAGKERLCLAGAGVLPLGECLRVLADGGYAGWHTLEWEKHWHAEIEEPEAAFPAFVAHMRRLGEELGIGARTTQQSP